MEINQTSKKKQFSKKEFSKTEIDAARDASFPLQRVRYAIRALNRRIKLAGGDVEKCLEDDRWWESPEKARGIHERMFCAVYVLYNPDYPCKEQSIEKLILILANRFAWCHFPIIQRISSN